MIPVDTDVLSAMAKADALPLLFALFPTEPLCITPGVVAELQRAAEMGRPWAQRVFGAVDEGRVLKLLLTPGESAMQTVLPDSLGPGERDSIAVIHERGGILLSNESRVAYWCRDLGLTCARLPDLLRALWAEGIAPKATVEALIGTLAVVDDLHFDDETITAVLSDE